MSFDNYELLSKNLLLFIALVLLVPFLVGLFVNSFKKATNPTVKTVALIVYFFSFLLYAASTAILIGLNFLPDEVFAKLGIDYIISFLTFYLGTVVLFYLMYLYTSFVNILSNPKAILPKVFIVISFIYPLVISEYLYILITISQMK